MNKFGFIGHPQSVEHFLKMSGFWEVFLRKISPYKIKSLMYKLPPFNYNLMRIKSQLGIEACGNGIILPLLPEQIILLGEEQALNKIEQAVRIATRLGARVVGLGGFTSVVGDEGVTLSKRLSVPLTSGNTYPAYLAIEGIKKAASLFELDLRELTATIIGATGDIGSICSKILSKKVKKIYIVARKENKLNDFKNTLTKFGTAEICVPNSVDEAISVSDVILTATTSISGLVDPLKLKPGAIVCDVGFPANITRDVVRVRNDVFVFEGGLCSLPFIDDINDKKFHKAMLSKNCVYGCLGETILLCLDQKFESFSIGRGNITEEKVDEIGRISKKHGFGLSKFFCGYKIYDDKDIDSIKSSIQVKNGK